MVLVCLSVLSQTPGVSAVQLRRQLGLSRYETAFQKSFTSSARGWCARIRTGSAAGPASTSKSMKPRAGSRTRGKGRGVHDKVLVASAVEVRQRKPGTSLDKRKGGRYAGRVRLAIVPDRSAKSLCGFVECAVVPGTSLVTDDWSGYAPALPSAATNTSPSLNGAIRRSPRSICRSSISSPQT